ncbi:MAG TPA: hypothetical protein V6D28_00135 [Leptolyngbyaceae cyanobacterium]
MMSQNQDLIFEEPKSNHIQAIVNIHNSNVRSQNDFFQFSYYPRQSLEVNFIDRILSSVIVRISIGCGVRYHDSRIACLPKRPSIGPPYTGNLGWECCTFGRELCVAAEGCDRISPKYFALPSTNNRRLPSPKLAKCLETESDRELEEFAY